MEETIMVIGDRLRELREKRNFSQGEIEKRSGLLRCYISRVENGYTIPAVETLEKFARALEVPIYQLLYDGENPPEVPDHAKTKNGAKPEWGSSGRDARILRKFRQLLGKTDDEDKKLLLSIAQKMARKRSK
jgi:transcriptional regulator with XRE-family HTH domain